MFSSKHPDLRNSNVRAPSGALTERQQSQPTVNTYFTPEIPCAGRPVSRLQMSSRVRPVQVRTTTARVEAPAIHGFAQSRKTNHKGPGVIFGIHMKYPLTRTQLGRQRRRAASC